MHKAEAFSSRILWFLASGVAVIACIVAFRCLLQRTLPMIKSRLHSLSKFVSRRIQSVLQPVVWVIVPCAIYLLKSILCQMVFAFMAGCFLALLIHLWITCTLKELYFKAHSGFAAISKCMSWMFGKCIKILIATIFLLKWLGVTATDLCFAIISTAGKSSVTPEVWKLVVLAVVYFLGLSFMYFIILFVL